MLVFFNDENSAVFYLFILFIYLNSSWQPVVQVKFLGKVVTILG